MKKILSIILMLSLAVTCAFAFASCGECQHLDDNGDGKCDECEQDYCAKHVDSDRDGVCDRANCGAVVRCANHVDVDNDGICDTIGCSVLVACDGDHVDEDGDEICDKANCTVSVPKAAVDYATASAPFVSALANKSNAVNASVTVTMAGEELNASYVLTKTADGFSLEYVYEQIAGLDSDVEVLTGTVTVDAAGNVVSGDAAMWTAFAANDLNPNIATGVKEFDAAGNVLTITVAAADTATVFGKAFASDVVSTITLDGAGKVASITLNYTQADGSSVEAIMAYQA